MEGVTQLYGYDLNHQKRRKTNNPSSRIMPNKTPPRLASYISINLIARNLVAAHPGKATAGERKGSLGSHGLSSLHYSHI